MEEGGESRGRGGLYLCVCVCVCTSMYVFRKSVSYRRDPCSVLVRLCVCVFPAILYTVGSHTHTRCFDNNISKKVHTLQLDRGLTRTPSKLQTSTQMSFLAFSL